MQRFKHPTSFPPGLDDFPWKVCSNSNGFSSTPRESLYCPILGFSLSCRMSYVLLWFIVSWLCIRFSCWRVTDLLKGSSLDTGVYSEWSAKTLPSAKKKLYGIWAWVPVLVHLCYTVVFHPTHVIHVFVFSKAQGSLSVDFYIFSCVTRDPFPLFSPKYFSIYKA